MRATMATMATMALTMKATKERAKEMKRATKPRMATALKEVKKKRATSQKAVKVKKAPRQMRRESPVPLTIKKQNATRIYRHLSSSIRTVARMRRKTMRIACSTHSRI